MAFAPQVLHPEPDPLFVAELKKIDPDLRVTWAYTRYLLHRWVIERKIPRPRYVQMYASLLQSSGPRFIDTPIYDDDQPIYDEEGNLTGHQVVGYLKYDLAPEYEHVMFVEGPDKEFWPLDRRTLLKLKRTYAWERFHSFSRLKAEKERLREEQDKAFMKQAADEAFDAFKDQRRELYDLPFSGQPKTVFESKES